MPEQLTRWWRSAQRPSDQIDSRVGRTLAEALDRVEDAPDRWTRAVLVRCVLSLRHRLDALEASHRRDVALIEAAHRVEFGLPEPRRPR
jgi:hypothetical protein